MASARDLVLRYISDTSDLRKSAQSVRKSVQAAAAEAKKAGAGVGGQVAAGTSAAVKKGMSAAWGVVTTTAKVGGAAVAAIGGAAIAKGFGRLTAIEDAEAKLRGLGNSAADTKKIMNNALASVKGTAFGMDEAATTAATAVAAGIKPGKELEKYLRLTADAAQIAGTDMGEMGSILNKVTTSGMAMTDDLNQIADRGIPIWTKLAEHYKVSGAELRDMVSHGAVDAKTFRKVLTETVGGAAESAGNTTKGAFKNMGAALSRLGANMLQSVFPLFKQLFGGITDLMDQIGPVAEKLGKKLGDFFKPFATAFSDITKQVSQGDFLSKISKQLAPFIALGKQLGTLLGNIAKSVLPAVAAAFKGLLPVAQGVAKVLTAIIKFINDHLGLFQSLAAGVLAVVAALTIYDTAIKTVQLATKAWAAAQAILNAVMSANPIGLVILAVAALAAAFVVAYNKSATFRKIVDAAFNGIKTVATAVIDWFVNDFVGFFTTTLPNAFRTVLGWLQSNWPKILAILTGPIGLAVLAITTHKDQIVNLFRSIVSWVTTKFAPVMKVFRAVGSAFAAVGRTIRAVYTGWIQPIFQLMGAIVVWLSKKIFAGAMIALKAAWRGLGTAIKVVYNSIIKPVIDAFAKIIRWANKTVFQPVVKALKQGWKQFALGLRVIYNTIIKPVIDAVARLVRWLYRQVFQPMLAAIRSAWSAMGRALRTVVNHTITPVLNVFKAGLRALRDLFQGVSGKIKSAWTGVSSSLKNTWKTGISTVFSAFKKAGNTMKSGFGTVTAGIGKQWGKLKGWAQKPIKFVIDTVINKGLIGTFNKLADFFDTKHMSPVPVPFRRGGEVPGPHVRRDIVPSILTPNEHVWTDDEMRKFPGGHAAMYRWRQAVRSGAAMDYPPVPFASGGKVVRPVPGGFGRFPSYAGHTGVDFPVGTGTPVHAVMDGIIKAVTSLTTSYGRHIKQSIPVSGANEALYAHLQSFATSVGKSVSAGDVIGHTDSTGNSTGPHLHFTRQFPGGNYVDPTSLLNGGVEPSSSLLGKLWGKVKGVVKQLDPMTLLKNAFNSLVSGYEAFMKSPFGQLGVGMINKAKDAAVGWVKDKLTTFGLGGSEPAGSGAQRWRGTIIQALRMNGLPTTDAYVNAWLRQVQSESGGNAKAVQNGYVDVNTISGDLAKGLLQTISATFNAYKFPGHDDIFNGLDNAVAAIHYALSRYGRSGMLGVIGHGHGYDSGGYLPPGLSLAINKTGRPEPVLTGRQWDAMAAGQPGITVIVEGDVLDGDQTMRKIVRGLEEYQRRRGGVNLPARSRKLVRGT